MRKTIEEKGFPKIRTWIRARNYKRAMLANHKKAEAFVISFPKCGRTWHRVMLGFYLTAITGLDPRKALDLKILCEKARLNKLGYTHNGSSPTHYLPSSHPLVANPIEWTGKDVIVLVRDPRDTMVSAYHHMVFRERAFKGTISEFIRYPVMGIERLATSWERWHKNRNLARSWTVFSYEEMHENPAISLIKTLQIIGSSEIDDVLVRQAVKFGSFENLQKLESSDFFNTVALRNKTGNPQASKVRQGQVGGYRKNLSTEDISYIENAINSIGDPFLSLQRGE